MPWQKIQVMCGQCQGTGKITAPFSWEQVPPPPEIDCPGCEGKGYKPWGRLKVEAD